MGATLEQIRWWSWRRQRLDRSCRGIDDCLRSIVGVYSSNPQGALSLLARVPRMMQGMLDGAIEGKAALRLPAMRRTVWILHAETAHFAFNASSTIPPFSWLLRRSGISEEEYARVSREVLLAAGRPMQIDAIREVITDPPEKLSTVLQVMCGEGTLLRVKAQTQISNTFSYVATRVWLGRELPETDPKEALAWLAGGYLKAFGPASAEDFAWWAGAQRRDAEEALAAHEFVDVGDGLLMLASDAKAFELTRPVAGRVNLLPAWDAYTMGYAERSRARFAPAEMLPYLYDRGGNATSVILIEGAVGGLWDFTIEDRAIVIRVGLFEDPSPRAWAAIQAEASLVAGFFNARDMQIKRVKIRSPIANRDQGSHLKPLAGLETRKPRKRAKAQRTKAEATASRNSRSNAPSEDDERGTPGRSDSDPGATAPREEDDGGPLAGESEE